MKMEIAGNYYRKNGRGNRLSFDSTKYYSYNPGEDLILSRSSNAMLIDLLLLKSKIQTSLIQHIKLVYLDFSFKEICGPECGQAVLNHNSIIGGQMICNQKHLMIQIGPLDEGGIVDFLKGGRKRQLLEDKVLPALLPVGWTYTIQLFVDEEHRKMVISTVSKDTRLGINSYF